MAATAMRWSASSQKVALPHGIATGMLAARWPVHYVRTGRRLSKRTHGIDHCLPWSAWPCGDLWNLMPAHRTVNQRLKRDRLPSPSALRQAEDRIRAWWEGAYLTGGAVLHGRFLEEAAASLPTLPGDSAGAEHVFAAMSLQRLRLHRDQGVPEWGPPAPGAEAGSPG